MFANIVNLDVENNFFEFIKRHELFPYVRLWDFKDYDQVDKTIPTLYLGYNEMNKRVADINIGDPFISPMERWGFTPSEAMLFCIEGCTEFMNQIPKMLTQGISAESLEPVFSELRTISDIETGLRKYGPHVFYTYDGVFTLCNGTGKILTINSDLWGAFGVKEVEIREAIKNTGCTFGFNDNNASIRVFFIEKFNFQPSLVTLYAPYLIYLKHKSRFTINI